MKVKKNLKHVFSFLLIVCMVSGLVGTYVPGGVAKAADSPATYTVEWDGVSDFFLGNKTATSGPITLKYTVAELTISSGSAIGNNGVMATTKPTASSPYASGHMQYTAGSNQIVQLNNTYELTISLDENGKVTGSWSRTAPSGTQTDLITTNKFGSSTGSGNIDSTNFGIYIGGNTTGKLTNVTCTDANGNDLGLQSNKTCNIQKDVEPMGVTSYTVEWDGVSDFFLGNEGTDYTGPITLKYTVAELAISSGSAIGNNGVMATTKPTTSSPYASGHMQYTAGSNQIVQLNNTYELTISLDENGKVTGSWSRTAPSGTQTDLITTNKFGSSTGSGNIDSTNFGIYIGGNTTGKLTNVTCTDANGNDLGLQSNKTCTITAEQDSKVQEFTAAQYATYRTGGAGKYTAPTAPDGYVFAGWFSDKTCKTALKTDTIASDAVAYAKYVDADILSVKCQIPANAELEDTTTTLRLVTTVDCLDYSMAGFEVSVADGESTLYTTRKAYDKIQATVDNTTTTYMPYVFSSESGHFMALEITGVPSEVFNETITVTPAWKTLDGTIVRATENCRSDIKIADAIANLGQ